MRTSIHLTIVASLFLAACGPGGEASGGSPISTAELAARLEGGSPPNVLDVRTREEYARGHIPGALNIPHDELARRIAELPFAQSEEIIVHCQSGRRAQLAEETLRENAYSNVRDLTGHWQEWQASGLPTE